MKRKILFGSILVVFIMLLLPTIQAVEYGNSVESNEDILKEAILKRIEELKEQNISFKVIFSSDPDGPFEGGLDDRTDWRDLVFAIIYGGVFTLFLKNQILQKVIETGEINTILLWIVDYVLYSRSCLQLLGDAFDIIDPDENGS